MRRACRISACHEEEAQRRRRSLECGALAPLYEPRLAAAAGSKLPASKRRQAAALQSFLQLDDAGSSSRAATSDCFSPARSRARTSTSPRSLSSSASFILVEMRSVPPWRDFKSEGVAHARVHEAAVHPEGRIPRIYENACAAHLLGTIGGAGVEIPARELVEQIFRADSEYVL